MKNIVKKHLPAIVSFILLSSCGDKESLLIDKLEITPIVNPNSKVIVKSGYFLKAELFESNRIEGVSESLLFDTDDYFQSFNYLTYSKPYELQITDIQGNNFLGKSTYYTQPQQIIYSLNKGQSWEHLVPQLERDENIYNYEYRAVSIKFHDQNLIYYLEGKSKPYSIEGTRSALLHKIDLGTGKAELLSKIEDYYPIIIEFIDENNGWVLLNKVVPLNNYQVTDRNAFIARTKDGGKTWSEPVFVDGSAPYKNLIVTKYGTIFIFNGEKTFYSNNYGETWKLSPMSIYNVVGFDSMHLLTLNDVGLFESNNGGGSWELKSSKNTPRYTDKISFINEKQGIAYGGNSLYLTNDGGTTWKTLLYPYPYIMQ
ncbi:glycoside hydrolase [Solitalea sp. MAHUQ-68]|uniref:Glycoside hydrolase n=1 Tax=Solitalea agri TaxID=2953739 RepID=A0A9X2JAG2_9SPHI|nr:sialidase family protein [Solitalea agri]MCO4291382.1 glycoside hydrolase [Solitalea agri]